MFVIGRLTTWPIDRHGYRSREKAERVTRRKIQRFGEKWTSGRTIVELIDQLIAYALRRRAQIVSGRMELQRGRETGVYRRNRYRREAFEFLEVGSFCRDNTHSMSFR